MVNPDTKEETLDIFAQPEADTTSKQVSKTVSDNPVLSAFDPLSDCSETSKTSTTSSGELDLMSQIQGWGAKHVSPEKKQEDRQAENVTAEPRHNPNTGLDDSRVDDFLPSPDELAKQNE